MKERVFILFSVLCFIAGNQIEAFSSFQEAKLGVTKKETDEIKGLPGQPNVSFRQYGGYVTVNSIDGRALYYYFVEAQKSHHTLPLLLWLNAGTGCSSLGYGAFTELGPFRVNSDGKTLHTNKYAWNNVTNVLFLESPAGTGFSYSNKTVESTTIDDKTTAIDNYVFLINWLERFPEFEQRPFYIGGESYAGHYVPQLAEIILDQNKKAKTTIVNLQGIILGNAKIDDETESIGKYEYWGSHALISDDTEYAIKKYCDFASPAKPSKKCKEALHEAEPVYDEFYLPNIYHPICWNPKLTDMPKKTSIFNFDPCSDYYVQEYLNRADVQKALHANVTKMIPCVWKAGRHASLSGWTHNSWSTLPLLKSIMKKGIQVWIFSGDLDASVTVTATQLALKKMKLTIETLWHPWSDIAIPAEVAGFTQDYVGNLTFATIVGAGQRVASYQPSKAFVIISSLLDNKQLPNYTIEP